MALENLITPENRVERLLSGADLDPATRLEYFLKQAGSGGDSLPPYVTSDKGKVLTLDDAIKVVIPQQTIPNTGMNKISIFDDEFFANAELNDTIILNVNGTEYSFGCSDIEESYIVFNGGSDIINEIIYVINDFTAESEVIEKGLYVISEDGNVVIEGYAKDTEKLSPAWKTVENDTGSNLPDISGSDAYKVLAVNPRSDNYVLRSLQFAPYSGGGIFNCYVSDYEKIVQYSYANSLLMLRNNIPNVVLPHNVIGYHYMPIFSAQNGLEMVIGINGTTCSILYDKASADVSVNGSVICPYGV